MPTEIEEKPATETEPHRGAPQVTPPPELPPASPRKALLLIAVVLIVLVIGGAARMISRASAEHDLVKETDADAVPNVEVVHPTGEKPNEELVLPASLQAYEESPIYARTNGYLVRWYKDIGSHVNKGDLLADIDTPEIDQELAQAQAARQQSSAASDLAKSSAERWENLRKSDSVSQQETDTQISGYKQSVATLAASEANVRRLEQMESFKHVHSPFSGVLIKRNVDPGALINAGSGGVELFVIARVDPLRVFANVPQAYSPAMKKGMPAYVTLQELPGQKFKGTVTRTADAIDPTARTLLTEVDVPNSDGRLLPGSFGEVHFDPKIDAQKITVPVNAMLFRKEGPRVAVVGPDNKVQLRPIVIGRDYGSTLEILSGVSLDDRVIINPADSLEEGQKVNIATSQQQDGKPS